MGMPLERKTPAGHEEQIQKRTAQARAQWRWAGMDEEAERLLKTLHHAQTPAEDKAVATPPETD